MGVTKGRVSQIERGQASGQDVLARYAAALIDPVMLVTRQCPRQESNLRHTVYERVGRGVQRSM